VGSRDPAQHRRCLRGRGPPPPTFPVRAAGRSQPTVGWAMPSSPG
jgi:hypothetical protein